MKPDRPPVWRVVAAAVVALPLAYVASTSALAVIARTADPERAVSLAGEDPLALARLAQSGVSQKGQVDQAKVTEFGRRSVAAQGLNPRAIELLGTAAAARGELGKAKRLFALSNAQSRRNLTTQIWLIEEAVQANDVPRAFVHYNAALRTRTGSHNLLFPVLTAALEDRRLWPAFTPYIDPSNRWLGGFFRHAFRQTPNPEAFAQLLAQAPVVLTSSEMESLQGELLRRLISRGSLEHARTLYMHLPGASAATFSSAELTGASADARYAPISWMLFQREGVSAHFQREGAENEMAMAFTIDEAPAGMLARKLVVTPPGAYSLSARISAKTAAADVVLTWSVMCQRGERTTLLERVSANLGETARQVQLPVRIPASCPSVMIDLSVAGGGEGSEVELDIDRVSFTRTGA